MLNRVYTHFFLFHPKNYYKSLRVIHLVIRLTICKSLEEYMPSGINYNYTL